MTCSIRDNAEQKIWNMVNIYKGLKRRGGKKKPLKIGILGLKSKFSAMLSSKISCIIWKKKLTFTQKKNNIWKNGKKKNQCDTWKFCWTWHIFDIHTIIFCLSGCMAERLKHKIDHDTKQKSKFLSEQTDNFQINDHFHILMYVNMRVMTIIMLNFIEIWIKQFLCICI